MPSVFRRLGDCEDARCTLEARSATLGAGLALESQRRARWRRCVGGNRAGRGEEERRTAQLRPAFGSEGDGIEIWPGNRACFRSSLSRFGRRIGPPNRCHPIFENSLATRMHAATRRRVQRRIRRVCALESERRVRSRACDGGDRAGKASLSGELVPSDSRRDP